MEKPNQLLPLVGWPLLPLPDEHGRLNFPTLPDSVRQALRIILSTSPGEQLMRPEFGAGLQSYLGEPNTISLRRRIHDTVSDALATWEDRILLDRVEVSEDAERPTHIRVEIAYRLRRTGAPQQVGLTLELGA